MFWGFFRHGVRLTVNGLLLGMVVTITTAQYIESLFYKVAPTDPWILGGILLTLGIVAGIASWLPARRAAKLNPMEALRYEG